MAIGSKTVHLTIPVNWLWGIAVVAAGLIVAFIFTPQPTNIRPILTFAGAVLAGAAALTTAINNVDQRAAAAAATEDQAGAAVRAAENQKAELRKIAALDLFYRWTNPNFSSCKTASRKVMDHFKTLNGVDAKMLYLKENRGEYSNLLELLNAWEGMAIAVELGIVDEVILRRFFRGLVIDYWHQTEDIIKKSRAEVNNPRLWIEFETLYSRWKN